MDIPAALAHSRGGYSAIGQPFSDKAGISPRAPSSPTEDVSPPEARPAQAHASSRDGSEPKLPFVLVLCAFPAGHVQPLSRLVAHLSASSTFGRGFPVFWLAGSSHRAIVEASGAEFVPLSPQCDFTTASARARFVVEREEHPPGLRRLAHDREHTFVAPLPEQWACVKGALEALRRRDPARQVVLLNESTFLGALPGKFGAALPEGYDTFPPSVGVGVVPLHHHGAAELAPFGLGLPPDATNSGLARNSCIERLLREHVLKRPYELFAEVMRQAGCPQGNVPDDWHLNIAVEAHDAFLQMCTPSIEYAREGMPRNVVFAGAVPPDPTKTSPEGAADPHVAGVLAELATNAALPADDPRKRAVVVITQGTVATDAAALIVPTLRALAGRGGLLVVAILGVRGAALPKPPSGQTTQEETGRKPALSSSSQLSSPWPPGNARVLDYLPYDLVLPYASVFVHGGGYGGLQHAIAHAVPVVQAGMSEDKPEVGARIEWAGMGVYLRKAGRWDGVVTEEMVSEAVDRVLRDEGGGFGRGLDKLRKEAQEARPLETLEREIVRLVSG